jgi:hypothetical protein
LYDYSYKYSIAVSGETSRGVRCSLYNTVNPGDTVIYGGDTFDVGNVTINVGETMTMELKEA